MNTASSNDCDPPMFSECVIGYRTWIADADGQLWPIRDKRRPWQPGVNNARCNRSNPQSLRLQWANRNGRVSLERGPAHDAPIADCDCGLYSWRRPRDTWYDEPSRFELPIVIGAVASWGALHVHDSGFRAQYACIVTLAHPADTASDAMTELRAIASRYRVELTPLTILESVAGLHGAPLGNDVRHRSAAAATTSSARRHVCRAAHSKACRRLQWASSAGFGLRVLRWWHWRGVSRGEHLPRTASSAH